MALLDIEGNLDPKKDDRPGNIEPDQDDRDHPKGPIDVRIFEDHMGVPIHPPSSHPDEDRRSKGRPNRRPQTHPGIRDPVVKPAQGRPHDEKGDGAGEDPVIEIGIQESEPLDPSFDIHQKHQSERKSDEKGHMPGPLRP